MDTTRRVKGFELKNIQNGIQGLNGIMNVDLGICRGRISREVIHYLEDSISFMKTEEWERISNLMKAVSEKYCVRDDKGAPIPFKDNYYFTAENKPLFDAEMEKLKKKEKDSFALRAKLIEEHDAKMKQEADIDLKVIPLSLIKKIEKDYLDAKKDSPFSTETIDLLMPIIDEDN